LPLSLCCTRLDACRRLPRAPRWMPSMGMGIMSTCLYPFPLRQLTWRIKQRIGFRLSWVATGLRLTYDWFQQTSRRMLIRYTSRQNSPPGAVLRWRPVCIQIVKKLKSVLVGGPAPTTRTHTGKFRGKLCARNEVTSARFSVKFCRKGVQEGKQAR